LLIWRIRCRVKERFRHVFPYLEYSMRQPGHWHRASSSFPYLVEWASTDGADLIPYGDAKIVPELIPANWEVPEQFFDGEWFDVIGSSHRADMEAILLSFLEKVLFPMTDEIAICEYVSNEYSKKGSFTMVNGKPIQASTLGEPVF